MRRLGFVSIAGLSLVSAACVLGPAPNFAHHVATGTYCASKYAADVAPVGRTSEEASVPARAAVEKGYSPRALDVARAIGALAQVEQLAYAASQNAADPALPSLRGQVNDTISLATLDLASTVAHLGCEEGRASHIATDLRGAEQVQIKRLTAYSLLLGAAASIVGGVLTVTEKNPVPGAAVGIGGGVAGGAFGFGTLAVHRKTMFLHTPNILGELWWGGAHPSFPEMIWAYLTRPQFSRTGGQTLRDYIIATWKESGLLGPDPAQPSEELVRLYFGHGGTYDADGLEDRASMLSDVREVVSLMNHGLQHLAAEVARR